MYCSTKCGPDFPGFLGLPRTFAIVCENYVRKVILDHKKFGLFVIFSDFLAKLVTSEKIIKMKNFKIDQI